MHENIAANIELRWHSDCRGKENFCLAFSQWLANQLKTWLKFKGISEDRVVSTGVGKAEPIAICENCDCSENIHRKNRRIDIIVSEK